MGKYWPLMVLSALILTACLSGVHGQYPTPSTGYSASIPSSGADKNALTQYSEYYTMTTAPFPGTHITVPEKFELTGNMPSKIYYSNQQQAVPYYQYQTYATYTGGNSLWIQGATSWTQFAVVPQSAFLSLIAASPKGGNGYLYEINPDGGLKKNRYYFYPSNRIGFYADQIGQHILLFVIDGQVSNSVVIEVTAYSQPTIYYPPIYNQPSYYVPAFSYYQQLFKLCPDGRQLCNGQCCPQGQNCIDGRCQTPLCSDGRAKCSGLCCPADKTCINGVCQPIACPDGRAKCSGLCCPADKTCINGVCQPIACPDGRAKCSGQCCPADKTCINGVCQPIACPDGRARCSGQCCPEHNTCASGVCRPVTEAEARAAESRRQQAAANGTYDPTKGITPYL